MYCIIAKLQKQRMAHRDLITQDLQKTALETLKLKVNLQENYKNTFQVGFILQYEYMTHTKLKYSINSFLMRQRIYHWIVIAGPNLKLHMLPFNLQPLLHHISNPLLPERNLFLYNSAKGKGMGWLSLMSRSVEIKLLPFGFCLFPWVLIFAICKKSIVLQDSPTFSCHCLPTACSNLAPLPSQ